MEKIDTLAIFRAEMAKKSNADDGAKGKSAEVALKNFINPKSALKGYVTPQAKNFDIFVRSNRKQVNIEIKSACGELAILEDVSSSISEMISTVYPKSTFIAYCPEIDCNVPIEKQFFMFSRDEFISMCESYEGRGSILRTKEATNTTIYSQRGAYRLSFQSFQSNGRPKASKPMAEHIWDCCYNQPTVEEWLEEKGNGEGE